MGYFVKLLVGGLVGGLQRKSKKAKK